MLGAVYYLSQTTQYVCPPTPCTRPDPHAGLQARKERIVLYSHQSIEIGQRSCCSYVPEVAVDSKEQSSHMDTDVHRETGCFTGKVGEFGWFTGKVGELSW